ncbi:MAG: peptidylprolyl isomerase [Cyclobacteriaceae bacterium]
MRVAFFFICLFLLTASFAQQAITSKELLLAPDDQAWQEKAPDEFEVRITSTKGDFVIKVKTEWAPIGATRFYHLVNNGFFDDSRFFRVKKGFIAQFGIPGNPEVTANWVNQELQDDPVVQSNLRGFLAYAMTGPNTRTTQIYINLQDNARLDEQGFAPFGEVIEGMDIVDALYSEYDESAGGGMRLGKQQQMLTQGNAHLDKNFPKLDKLIKAEIVE